MKTFISFFFLYLININTAFALLLPAFDDLPVQWEKKEYWRWQGQKLLSQRFSSSHDVAALAALIQQRLSTVDLRLQRMSSSWLLSFDHFPSHTHYLFLLSAQSHGSQGWLSAMQLSDVPQTQKVMPPDFFKGLYQHSWSLESQDNQRDGPLYFVLQPISHGKYLWEQLIRRLERQFWQGQDCDKGQWCQWHKKKQQLWLVIEPESGLWHVLWWPVFLR